jgi:polysaccharide pyruvyl transferase WcaK-like protein
MVGHRDVAAFVRHTGKPFGVYGITYGGFGTSEKDLLGKARFAFFRDSVSLAKAKSDGIKCPVMAFAPDGAFAADVRDDEAAKTFLSRHGLEEGKFLCCIPRLRYTPYWKIHGRPMDAEADRKHARNEALQEHDHAPLREAIVAVTRRRPATKVLLCPEDRSQMAVGKEMLLDKLPADVRENVVWREDFWLTDEALATYVRSAGLFGLEMHSPIMCVGNGVPAIVCRFAEQTSKGFMWRDVGLGEWLFDFDREEEMKRLTPAVLSLLDDPAVAKAKVAEAREFVRRRQRETMAIVGDAVRS